MNLNHFHFRWPYVKASALEIEKNFFFSGGGGGGGGKKIFFIKNWSLCIILLLISMWLTHDADNYRKEKNEYLKNLMFSMCIKEKL